MNHINLDYFVSFRILNPKSMLPYLRQFPNSAYCAIEWKKKINGGWTHYNYDLHRFGIDTQVLIATIQTSPSKYGKIINKTKFDFLQSLDRMMSIPVKYTLKRRLNDAEIESISTKRFKVLETVFTADDDNDNVNGDEIEYETQDENIPKAENFTQEG